MSQIELPIALFHHRWAIPIVAEVHRSQGAKFVTLAKRLSLSKDSLQRTLKALIEIGLLKKNPGHGHPMRPEYVLTAAGALIAPKCERLADRISELGLEDVAYSKWSLPVLKVICSGVSHFTDIKSALNIITSRALSLSLSELASAGLIVKVGSEPGAKADVYEPTVVSRNLARLVPTILSTL